MQPYRSNGGTAALICALAACGLTLAADNRDKVVGSDACKECHTSEHAAWTNTHHAKSLDALREGQAIADKLQLGRTFRREGFCVDCHTTAKLTEGKPAPMSGVSCESCHGPAADWIKIHNDFGGPDVKKEQESAAHRAERWQKAEAAGMIRPTQIDRVAGNCYGCHSVPHEQLVNVGGHKAGSDFELVSWSQGEVRHNYLSSNGSTNAAATAERKRVLYVVGKLKDLEAGLRGLAKITDAAGPFAASMVGRTKSAMAALADLNGKQKIAEVDAMLGTLGTTKATPAAAPGLADQAAAAAAKVAKSYDGKAWGALDAVIPTTAKGSAP